MHRYLFLAILAGCSPISYYLAPAESGPSGQAPGARHRLLASHDNGTRDYALVLEDGDELASAVLAFAKSERVVAARFHGLGAVRDAHVAWFDVARKQYRVVQLAEQLELASLVGDVGVDEKNEPIVHAHAVLSRDDGTTRAGHLIRGTTSPNAELWIKTFPEPLIKRHNPAYDSKFFDLAASKD